MNKLNKSSKQLSQANTPACVLILRFSGYNPIDYIPYRTYIRLLKNNCLVETSKSSQTNSESVETLSFKSSWF